MKLFKKDRVFYSNVLSLAIPIAFQSAITVGVNILDNYMVSNVSQDSLSAVSLANTFISIFQIFCMGLGMGASVLVSRYWGMMKKNDHYEESSHALKQTICLMLRLTLLFAAIFAAITGSSVACAVTIGAIQRALLRLEDQGANTFFGEPALDLNDWFEYDKDGRGVINLLHCAELFLLKTNMIYNFL